MTLTRPDLTARARRWTVIADFFRGESNNWLDDFIEDDALVFRKVPPPTPSTSWHARRSARATSSSWLRHLRHARAALADRPDGVIACFPQLAMCTALLKRFRRHRPKLIAYNYNLGGFPGGIQGWLARFVAQQIDIYVVHAPSEVESYAAYLGISPEKVRFVPLQRGTIDVVRREETEAPFILSMGSAHRDYPTLIDAVETLEIATVIVTRPSDAETLRKSAHVAVRSGLSPQDCMELLSRARFSVTPISNLVTASGQVTFVDAMQMGVPVIATRCPGTEGYVEDGRTGLLVPPSDPAALRDAIAALWSDADRRATLSEAASTEALTRFSDAAAAASLHGLILEIGGDPAGT